MLYLYICIYVCFYAWNIGYKQWFHGEVAAERGGVSGTGSIQYIGNSSSLVLSDSLGPKNKKKKGGKRWDSKESSLQQKSRSKVNASTVIKAPPPLWSCFTESEHAISVSELVSKVSWKCYHHTN
jgi:hypothetical protein